MMVESGQMAECGSIVTHVFGLFLPVPATAATVQDAPAVDPL